MVKVWQWELEARRQARPKILSEEEQGWEAILSLRAHEDEQVKRWWHSTVPGSGAPECLIAGAIQSMENRGYVVEAAERLFEQGLQALHEDDMITLHRTTSRILRALMEAPQDPNHPYWSFQAPDTWEAYAQSVAFPEAAAVDIDAAEFAERMYGGWLAQICGAALGTALEGYTTARLAETFGDIRGYVRNPNTWNDDITFELAFLSAFERHGYAVTSKAIADEWVARIPFGWSAEDIALRNLRLGIAPPESGRLANPFSEWIGAQMRGVVCGMVAPGDPKRAARLAWIDGVISHARNGVIGEAFNAIMAALAYTATDVRTLVQTAVALLPPDSEYRAIASRTLSICQAASDWRAAWQLCEQGFERYNWVHAYPNMAAEIVALWFGDGDFDETMHIIAMCGQDVDCNAAQIAAILGIAFGPGIVGEKWTAPLGNAVQTYVRGMESLRIDELAAWTVRLVRMHRASPEEA
ncbi:MAG: ADP-ribosylglycohydrolase family protein [Hydrogenibacillus sp.]|nr:ADP-ribosylglycohydrolase family protein [Hydrogenibacillus sp.]